MFPAYNVPPADLMEVVYTTAEAGPKATNEEIDRFCSVSNSRKVREAVKIALEIGLITSESSKHYSVPEPYKSEIQRAEFSERNLVVKDALLNYQPFRHFIHYIDKGYDTVDATQKMLVRNSRDGDEENIESTLTEIAEYAGVLNTSGETPKIRVEAELSDSVASEHIGSLESTLESKTDVILYLESTLGDELTSRLDSDVEDDLVTAFLEYSNDPRNSIGAAGRALEDYLRYVSRQASSDAHENGSGSGQIANFLKGDEVIHENHRKRIHSISGLRNKSGGHGEDKKTNKRWTVSPEIALHTAIGTTLLIRSIDQYVELDEQIL